MNTIVLALNGFFASLDQSSLSIALNAILLKSKRFN
jgi:hypothetical protein